MSAAIAPSSSVAIAAGDCEILEQGCRIWGLGIETCQVPRGLSFFRGFGFRGLGFRGCTSEVYLGGFRIARSGFTRIQALQQQVESRLTTNPQDPKKPGKFSPSLPGESSRTRS